MLCPECETPAAGGARCPHCGEQVPERETFDGQGTHYVIVLALVSLLLLGVTLLMISRNAYIPDVLRDLYATGWLWVYAIVLLVPVSMGVYYWFLLREEEITITDEAISRRSHWGNELLAWRDVTSFRRRTILFRQTRLGRVSWFSRILAHRKLFAAIPPARYELIGLPDDQGRPRELHLDPGTIDDLDWVIKLLQERIGPPEML